MPNRLPSPTAAICDLRARAHHPTLDFTRRTGPNGRTGEAQSRELDNTDVKQPKNVADVEFTDAADRVWPLSEWSSHRVCPWWSR